MKPEKGKVLMLGIGGMGMAPLAIYLNQRGFDIIGSDDNFNPRVEALLESNNILLKDFSDFDGSFQCLIYSNAISSDNSLLIKAKELGIPLIKRGEALAFLARDRKVMAVVGSHGKTTTTGLIIHLLKNQKFSFDYVLGGLFVDRYLPSHYSEDSEWLIVEVDESDRTINLFDPEITIGLNFDWDHCSEYKNAEDLGLVFEDLFKRTKGLVLVSQPDLYLQKIGKKSVHSKILSFGDKGDFVCRSRSLANGQLELFLSGRFKETKIYSRLKGEFNFKNITAALSACASIEREEWGSSVLDSFPGIHRRQVCLHRSENELIYEDYAHHPVEVDAFLKWILSEHPDRELFVVFQPHRYSRTLQYKKDFARVLDRFENVAILPVYSANEDRIIGGSSEDLMDEFKSSVNLCRSIDDLKLFLNESRKPRVVAFVGAGDIEFWAKSYVDSVRVQIDSFSLFSENLAHLSSELKLNEPLADKTTLRVGGFARAYIEPTSKQILQEVVQCAYRVNFPVFVLGRGSNLLVSEKGFNGLVVRMSSPEWQNIEKIDDLTLFVGSGARLKKICAQACKWGMSGFEFLEGIPGSLGGSLRMNAGAMGGWLFDLVVEVELMTLSGEIKTISKKDLSVKYRECTELQNSFALGAKLKSPGISSSERIRETMLLYSEKRKSTQPREPSAGCIFKNPEGYYAGELIEASGLKGLRVGSASISRTHGNFIINEGGATSNDIIELVRQVKECVYRKKGVNLNPEVLLMGQKWEDVL